VFNLLKNRENEACRKAFSARQALLATRIFAPKDTARLSSGTIALLITDH
jgi:hypothetical protein